jgi:hypothetical protein
VPEKNVAGAERARFPSKIDGFLENEGGPCSGNGILQNHGKVVESCAAKVSCKGVPQRCARSKRKKRQSRENLQSRKNTK